ncbi:dihydrodipicolinate synthase family protein [Elongatibacter sediminis]|uniref:Dihydrodipicolinate synthase family protein n=1 Tax=Elongatibacter sediminis TaxID=3119006 RepID=A0AAW9RCC9_9GAMM
MDRNSVTWRGYIPAITTPFDAELRFDEKMLEDLLLWLQGEGMHGIVLAGTTGEWFSLTADERTALFRKAGSVLGGKLPLLAGCNAFTPNESIGYARAAKEHGFDGILLTPPPYVVPTDDEIVAFYRTVNDAIDLPICVYNWPPGTGVDLSLDVLKRIVALDKVVAVKNSTGDMGRFIECFFGLKDQVRYYGVPTNEFGASLYTHHAADGMIGSGAVLGRDHPAFFDCLDRGQLDEALACGEKDRILMTDWFTAGYRPRFGTVQALMKEALNAQGLPGGYPRPPVLPIADEGKKAIRDTLSRLGRSV